MATPNLRTPSYRHHRPSGQAVVTLDGRDFYLGPHGSAESHAEYNRLLGEWLANGRRLPAVSDTTITELVPPYIRHCEQYYVKNGRMTNQVTLIRLAVGVLRRLYGPTFVKDFGPLALKACRAEFVRKGLSRRECNRRTSLIKQFFRWATENELSPPSVYQGLQAVAGLRKGRCEAPDPGPVTPVTDDRVEAVLPFLTPTVRAMVQVQRLSGMRPEEVTRLKAADLSRAGPTWTYRPESHKMEHHDKGRAVVLGTRAQSILGPRISTDPDAYLFRPADAFAEGIDARRKLRTSGSGVVRRFASRYTVAAYRRAIHRACDRAFPHARLSKIPRAKLTLDDKRELAAWRKQHRWSPNQLRHAFATEVRREFDLDTARAVLGHSTTAVTEIYAEKDLEAARRAVERLG